MKYILSILTAFCAMAPIIAQSYTASQFNYLPPFLTNSAPPLVMLVMGRDHTLYYEAYNDASDINEDGIIDTNYNSTITYYGYFDSYKYYAYNSTGNLFYPAGSTTTKKVPANNYWSGDFLNYLTMSRLDVLRKVLYGGFRRVDSTTETVLERANIPNDAHCWGKEYTSIAKNGYDIREFTPLSLPNANTQHLFASGSIADATSTSNNALLRVKLNSTYHVSKWVSAESGDGIMSDALIGGTPISDYQVRVKVGVAGLQDKQSEKLYTSTSGSSVLKPIGLLQRYGESNKIFFGLLSGSYQNHLSGGVLRKNISSIQDEINLETGQFKYIAGTITTGIIKTIDSLKVVGYDYSSNYWDATIYSRPINQGENYMWGNPVGEMMYETLRYFAGSSATTAFTTGITTGNDRGVSLPLETWKNPYLSVASGGLGFQRCATPIMLVLSDINPSYDTNQLPGVNTNFNDGFAGTFTANGTSFNAETLANAITTGESLTGNYYIGQSGATTNGACSEKNITSLGSIRGLCPEEPTKLGGYYAAAAAYFGRTNDINTANDTQSVRTYSVALASPRPKIEIPMGTNKKITLVPFAKTVYSTTGGGVSPTYGTFQPTCALVDFYADEISGTYGRFTVSFEHSEQGSDFDMDGLVQYQYNKTSENTVSITITNVNLVSGGGSKQHFGYIISGTSKDGIYLDIKNKLQADNDDRDYYLDTPPGVYPTSTYNATGPWKDNTYLPWNSTRTFTASSTGATLLNNPLWFAAKWGGFEEKSSPNNTPDATSEWDKDNNGVPDTYFYVANPSKLETQLTKAFDDILSRVSSGTAASVISQSREGQGAIYQSIFFPELKDSHTHIVNWAGQVHALFVDSGGNIREDTNKNKRLDSDDKIIVYDDTSILRYTDANNDNILSVAEKSNSTEVLTSPLLINFLWTSTDWLNDISTTDILTQRTSYNSTNTNDWTRRYIFAFADKNNNQIIDTNEIQDFTWPPTFPATYNSALNNSTDFYSYLTLYPSFSDTPTNYTNLRTTLPASYNTLIQKLAQRQIEFIRGKDQAQETVGTITVNATRSRTYTSADLSDKTWRLADIVYSTPTVVGKPAENYNLIYSDASYQTFLSAYKSRRQVIYVGANDGMLHAFNGGFYNSTTKGFDNSTGSEIPYQLGAELWSYIPYNLLPHLYWQTLQEYSNQLHTSYVDLKPRIFDARIFTNSTEHPGGWGTILVCGMRLGGGEIIADLDKTDGDAVNSTRDRTLSSGYVIADITNPELDPKERILAEIRMPKQGFTTSYPTVMPMAKPNGNSTTDDWYLVFGSGPANSQGQADPTIISTSLSNQNGQLYVVDLKALVQTPRKIRSLDGVTNSSVFNDGSYTAATTEPNSFIADPIAVDTEIGSNNASAEFMTNFVYYGTAATSQTNGTGTMRRIITNNNILSSSWNCNSTLTSITQPITSAPSVAVDSAKKLWVFFGTGRFMNRNDIPQAKSMSFYGIKDPIINGNTTSINTATLFNSTQIQLTNGTCTGKFSKSCVGVLQNGTALGNPQWTTLENLVASSPGWRQDFTTYSWERVIGQAAILGGAVIFTSYIPADDLCQFEGSSRLWALYYKTGTAYYNPIIRGAVNTFATAVDLGRGLSITPNLHVGDKSGSTAFIQTSTGAIETIELENPYSTKSGTLFWRKNTD